MQEERPYQTDLALVHNIHQLQLTNCKLSREPNEHLLNKSSYQDEITQGRAGGREGEKRRLHEQEGGVSSQNDCFPSFLSKVGVCCIPCRVYCPCFFCLCCPCRSHPLFQQQMQSLGLLQEWGRFQRVLQPGLHVINPISQSIVEINQQTKILEYRQIGISKDNVQFDLSVVVFYRVIDSLKLAYRLGDYDIVHCLTEIATGTLRSVLGENTLQVIIQQRDLVSLEFTTDLNRQISFWGIYVEISSLKEIRIDKEVQRALEAVTETKRRSEAMIINCKAEVQCGKLIKEISEIINNEASFQIRYLNMVEGILSNPAQQSVVLIKTSMEEVYQRLEWDQKK